MIRYTFAILLMYRIVVEIDYEFSFRLVSDSIVGKYDSGSLYIESYLYTKTCALSLTTIELTIYAMQF